MAGSGPPSLLAAPGTAAARPRRLRSDGERSRRAILDAAARLATVEGLEGLSIGRLAAAIGMSKSGLYAHFASKEDLQLAIVETAEDVFREEVVDRGLAGAPGVPRVVSLCEAFLDHVAREVFPGGCFFASAAAELDTRPGAVRERVARVDAEFSALIETLVREAQQEGEADPALDAPQAAFEIAAMLGAANASYVLHRDTLAFERARRGVRARLGLRG